MYTLIVENYINNPLHFLHQIIELKFMVSNVQVQI